MVVLQNETKGEKMTTYGIKRTTASGSVMVHTKAQGFMHRRFVGGGGYAPSEWKTKRGAERAAARLGVGIVFEISDNIMHYECQGNE